MSGAMNAPSSKSMSSLPQTDHPYKVMAIYKFAALPDAEALKGPLAEFCCGRAIKGTLILAPEGINGTVAGAPEAAGVAGAGTGATTGVDAWSRNAASTSRARTRPRGPEPLTTASSMPCCCASLRAQGVTGRRAGRRRDRRRRDNRPARQWPQVRRRRCH